MVKIAKSVLIYLSVMAVLAVLVYFFWPAINPPVERVAVTLGNDPMIGDPEAPITIVEWSDFQCPYCGKFERDTFPLIKKNYIDTGKAKLYFRHFPLRFHENAQKAAEASECANAQGKFWELHDVMYNNQEALGLADLKKYAKDLGLDTGKFNSCLDSGAMAEGVSMDMAQGVQAGVSGTPAFFLNGIPIVGNQPYKAFSDVLDREYTEVSK